MHKPIKSPIQAKIGSPLFLVKLGADLLKVHKEFMERVDEVANILRETKSERERIIALPKGEKGDKGERGESIVGPMGPQGPAGAARDGRDGIDGRDASKLDVMKVAEVAASLITQPKDGESPALESIVEAVLEKLDMDKRMKGFQNEVASYRNQLAGKVYGKDTWARGSGTTVSAGQNITLVPQADGTVKINASGGGSGTNVVTQYQLTAVQSGSDVTLDLSQLTHFATYAGLIAVYRNNVMQTETLQFTVSGSTVTIFNADASEIFNITYAYS